MSPQPIYARRLAANRANSAGSTFTVVEPEEPGAIAFYHPAHSRGLTAIDRIAAAQHSLQRCASLDAGPFTSARNEANADEVDTRGPGFCLPAGFSRLCQKSDSLKLFLRYQAQSERHYRIAFWSPPRQPLSWCRFPRASPKPLDRTDPRPPQRKAPNASECRDR